MTEVEIKNPEFLDVNCRKISFGKDGDQIRITRVLTYKMDPNLMVTTLSNGSVPYIGTKEFDSGFIHSSILSINGKLPCIRCRTRRAMLCLHLMCTKCYMELREAIPVPTGDTTTLQQLLFDRKDLNRTQNVEGM